MSCPCVGAGLAAAGVALVASAAVGLVKNICKGKLLQVGACSGCRGQRHCCLTWALLPHRPLPHVPPPGAVHRRRRCGLLLPQALDLPRLHRHRRSDHAGRHAQGDHQGEGGAGGSGASWQVTPGHVVRGACGAGSPLRLPAPPTPAQCSPLLLSHNPRWAT